MYIIFNSFIKFVIIFHGFGSSLILYWWKGILVQASSVYQNNTCRVAGSLFCIETSIHINHVLHIIVAIEITKKSLVFRIQTSVLGVFRLAADDNGSTTIVLHAIQGIDSHLSFQRRNLVAVILLRCSTTEWWVCYHHVNVLVCKRLCSVLTGHVLETLSSQVRQSLCINIVHMYLIHWQTDGKHTVAGTWLQSTLNFLAVTLHIHICEISVRGRGRILLFHHSLRITLVE